MNYLFRNFLPVALLLSVLLCNIIISPATGEYWFDIAKDNSSPKIELTEVAADESIVSRRLRLTPANQSAYIPCERSAGVNEQEGESSFCSSSKQAPGYGLLFRQYLF